MDNTLRRASWPQGADSTPGTGEMTTGFPLMSEPLQWIIERSFQIAWEYLQRSGQLGEPTEAGIFLFRTIEGMVMRGERRKIALANRAIDAYRRREQNIAA
jgi:hypothetical protein